MLVTSRGRLAGLAGAEHVEVDVFDADQSLDLLARIVGPDRVQAQPEAAAAVAGQCGHLPLALRIAGARLAARPHWSIQQLADRLADETRRLDELRHGDMGVRAEHLAQLRGRQRAGQAAVPAAGPAGHAGLLRLAERRAARPAARPTPRTLLDELVSAQLIETAGTGSGVHSQYRFHDLIRVFARERLAAEEPAAERQAALERALGALLYLAEEARCRYYGGDYLRPTATRCAGRCPHGWWSS